jgi:hypothetical protein
LRHVGRAHQNLFSARLGWRKLNSAPLRTATSKSTLSELCHNNAKFSDAVTKNDIGVVIRKTVVFTMLHNIFQINAH